MKAIVHSPDRDIDFFDNITGVLQGDTITPYLFIFCLDYVLWTSTDLIKENGFTLKNPRSRWYPTKTITDADYTDDQALLINARAQLESLLYNQEKQYLPCEIESSGFSDWQLESWSLYICHIWIPKLTTTILREWGIQFWHLKQRKSIRV